MIAAFSCKHTRALYEDGIARRAWRSIIDAAVALGDLRSPLGNRPEKLGGDRNGQWRIRINDQWRLCVR